MYLLLYVDDIIITSNNSSFVTEIVSQLGSSFALKDLGCLNYFLGLQIEYTDSGLFVHQSMLRICLPSLTCLTASLA